MQCTQAKRTFSVGIMVAASGVLGEATRAVDPDTSVGEAYCFCPPSKSLKPVGICITDWGSLSAESDRNRAGREVTIFGGGSCHSQCPNAIAHYRSRTFGLAGLLISMSGECTSNASPLAADSGDLMSVSSSSCASSSISVPSVPFESTGDGSICCGYGLGGGASESLGAEEL